MHIRRDNKMKELTVDEFEAKLASIPEEAPDEWDIKMLTDMDAEKDNSTTSLETVKARREYSGKISIRVPKELHQLLIEKAKDNGVSLNQFIVYKLASS